METPVFVTSNPAKAAQLSRHLGIELRHEGVDLPEIQSLDLAEVVEAKAKAAYTLIGAPVLVEDVSLVFPALGQLPGPLIKWFLTELGCSGLCGLLDGYRQRRAVAKVMFGLYDGESFLTFDSEISGTVSGVPRGGELSFGGWDSIFIPDGWAKTWAEMDEAEQAASSMRRPALKKLEDYLHSVG